MRESSIQRVGVVGAVVVAAVLGLFLGRSVRSAGQSIPIDRGQHDAYATEPRWAPAELASSTALDSLPTKPKSDSAPETLYFSRAETEWQGMLVNKTYRAICSKTADCGLGLSCLDDAKCGPCRTDGDCLVGESCALDHCVTRSKASCRVAADCKQGELCVLSSYSQGLRGNSDMRAYCLPPTGESNAEVLTEVVPLGPVASAAVVPADLLHALKSSR